MKFPNTKAITNTPYDHNIVRILLSIGLDIEKYNAHGFSLLTVACDVADEDFINILLKRGAKVDSNELDIATPLIFAVGNKLMKSVKLFLDLGADVNRENSSGSTAINSIAFNETEIAKLLLQKGADIDHLNANGNTLLIEASYDGEDKLVDFLLRNKANFKFTNRDGRNALMVACMRIMGRINVDKKSQFHMEVVKTLLPYFKDDLDLKDNNGDTALILSLKNKQTEIAEFLIDNGVDFDLADKDGDTPLMIASRFGNKEIFELLIGKGADVNKQNEEGETVLMISLDDSSYVMDLLEREDLNLDITGLGGNNALHLAVLGGYRESVHLLLGAGMRDYIENDASETAKDLAEKVGDSEMREIFFGEEENEIS